MKNAVAFANNDVVTVAWSFGKRPEGCMGFAIYRVEPGGKETPLPSHAVFKGYNVTLATNAHSTSSNSALSAEQIIAGENAVLPNLAGPGGATVQGKTTEEITFARAGRDG